jgi:hypothetical protein
MPERAFHRPLARPPALFLAVGILLFTLALRPLADLGLPVFDVLIGVSATMLVLLSGFSGYDGVAIKHSSLLFGCAIGLLLAPAPFLLGLWMWYAVAPGQFYGLCYAALALTVGFIAARRGEGDRKLFWFALLGVFLSMFCVLYLRWLIKLWDL